MKNRKFLVLFALILSLGFILAACGNSDDESSKDSGGSSDGDKKSGDYKVGMVTDVGGVDDKSFNQSAWEGLQAWGKEHDFEKGKQFDYIQSNEDADYMPNVTRLVRQDYNLIFGIGYKLNDGINKSAEQYPDTNFAIVDSVVDQPNVASITFKEHQGSFLVGVAAAKKTKTNKIGFVGGTDSELINKFESGYIAGAKSVNPDIKIDVQYAGAFDAPDDGKLIAANMYNNGVDVIYHSSGATGNGVFAQAKDIKQNDPEREIWVIGVDRDQYDEGQIGDYNITLTSMVKRVDIAVQDVSNKAMNGEFPGGKVLEYGLKDDAVAYAKTNKEALTDEIVKAIEKWKEKIVSGELEVPKTREETKAYVDAL
ncbi:BMP family ABC transporter substrate-binding protein [Virgibacillus phasianinus]|uniref:BMP family ABC transporter substrate-binding protein n=1 Tax=Virgibacillus phasianinus TaxID=2017483 RepID=A0A220U5R8_9BACI|nr:BMP family protein [Virgibacillus phasianinus]ASK63469.1 BMP family ABC transporter substrate-binding protein [Virgibacillus phasianinus]